MANREFHPVGTNTDTESADSALNLLHDACDWLSGAADVAAQVTAGAASTVYKAVTERPLETAVLVAEGVAVGAVVLAAAPVAAALGASAAVVGGIAVASDIALIGMTAAGTVAAGHDGIQAAGASAASVDVLMHKDSYSQAAVQAARADIQGKTGKAALEIAGAAAMGVGTWGSGMRLVRGAGEVLGRAELPVLKIVKSSELPAGSAVSLMKKFDGVIAERQESVNLPQLLETLKSLEAAKPSEIWYSEVGKAPRTLLPRELTGDPSVTRTMLQEQPESLTAFNIWLENDIAAQGVRSSIAREERLREGLIGKLLNGHASELFPEATMPAFTVGRMAPHQIGEAAYGNGKLLLRAEDLHQPSGIVKSGELPLVEKIVHELKHADQQGLLIRNYIDHVTARDTSIRRLTADEVQAVQEMSRTKLGSTPSDYLLQDLNVKRAGRPLSESETARAAELEAGFYQAYRTELAGASNLSGPVSFAEYSSWAHEAEALRVGREAAAQLR